MPAYGSVKRAVLELIDQSTMAGEPVPLSYNNQADYVRKIPNLLNQAITKIRTSVLPDRRTAELCALEAFQGCVRCALPPDCQSILSGGFFCLEPEGPRKLTGCSLMGGCIIIPAEAAAKRCFVEYFARPVQLPPDPEDGYNLEETPEVIQAAEYYAAAMLVVREDEYLYAALMSEYQSRLASMRPPITAEVHPVRDVYGF